MTFHTLSLSSPPNSLGWGVGVSDHVILVVRECIWNMLVVLLELPTLDDIGSLGYPSGFSLVAASRFLVGNREDKLKPTTFTSFLLFNVFVSFLFFNPLRDRSEWGGGGACEGECVGGSPGSFGLPTSRWWGGM